MAEQKKYTVKKGDTLSQIALDNNTTVKKLQELNDIENPDLIYEGQVLIISGGKSSTSSSSSSKSSNKATIVSFALQLDTDRTMFATWKWSKDNTDYYKVDWRYYTGDGVAFEGSSGNADLQQSIYTAPSNATGVRFRVKPIAKKVKKNGKETTPWTAEWSEEKKYYFKNNPPTTPKNLQVELKDLTLTMRLDNLDVNGDTIKFQVVKNDETVYQTLTAEITKSSASASCTVKTGTSYKVRCRAERGEEHSDWSEYVGPYETKPKKPEGITSLTATSKTSVRIEWSSVEGAETYEIQYATKKDYLASSDAATSIDGIKQIYYEKTGLESGQEYFFRVRAAKGNEKSAWTEIASIVLGDKPSAPTTWSSTTTAIVGEEVILYWVHNSKDGSSQTYAELEITTNGSTTTKSIQNSTDEDEKDKTSSYKISTTGYSEGATIEWRVRTRGVTDDYSDWSVLRKIDVYAKPSLELRVTNSGGKDLSTLTTFPFYVRGISGPETQEPIGYHLTVTANESYETVDNVGNTVFINKGSEVYSSYFDTNDDLLVEFTPGNINLENGIRYTVTCVVSMNSGLTGESDVEFTVNWVDEVYTPNAEISIDYDTVTAYIRPYCESYNSVNYEVTYNSSTNRYTPTTNNLGDIEGWSVDDAYTPNGDIVYKGTNSAGSEKYFYVAEPTEGTLVNGVTLSVYRREYDGTFVEIGTGLSNNTTVTDPHPALDYARYRIVAISESTGAISYYDVPGYPIDESAVIIQWDEEWNSFDVDSEDELYYPAWSGSMLKLPYNIDTSDSNSADVSLVKYIGRRHPVSYYGTQVGTTATWTVMVPMEDKATVYALRRLAIWMGDVYVREPSGSGYWANISVSFSQKHLETAIPVTLDIVRVEGGI